MPASAFGFLPLRSAGFNHVDLAAAAEFGITVVRVSAYSPHAVVDMGIAFVSLPALVASSDVITLHCPLTPKTCRLIDAEAIAQMERRPMLINTSRGALIDATAVQQIAEVTIENLDRMEVGESTGTEVTVHLVG